MRYTEYKEAIEQRLRAEPAGMTWQRLKAELRLPYNRPCPAWTRCLEEEIGLTRRPGTGKALVWALSPGQGR